MFYIAVGQQQIFTTNKLSSSFIFTTAFEILDRTLTNIHSLITPGDRIPTLKRLDILQWLNQIWAAVSIRKCFKIPFTASGYVCEDSVSYSGET